VCCQMLHRRYYSNDFIFVRPAVSTEYIDNDEPMPTYRVYYPLQDGMSFTLYRVVANFQLGGRFEDLKRDLGWVEQRLNEKLAGESLEPNCQLQVLSSLFCRNKGAYLVGRMINGGRMFPFVIPILHRPDGALYLDTVLLDTYAVTVLFSFTRAYFLVDMEVPSAYVRFLHSMLPHKPASEIYTILGLQKQGKTQFYRDFLHHLRHSSDRIDSAPGIRGLVM